MKYFAQFLYGKEIVCSVEMCLLGNWLLFVMVLAQGGKLGLAKINQENFIEMADSESFVFIKV